MNEPMRALANALTEKFILAAPQEAAKALESFATHEILLLIAPLKAQVLVRCLEVMTPAKAAAVLRRLPLKQASHIFQLLSLTQAAQVMAEFSAPYQARLTGALEPSFVQLLQSASSYAPDSAGRRMKTDFVAVRTENTVAQLVERLKNLPRAKLPSVCFVTTKDGKLKGFIRTPELAFYEKQSVCGSVMTPCEPVAVACAGEALAAQLAQGQTDWLPVVNEQQVLVGIISRFSTVETADEKPFWKKWTH